MHLNLPLVCICLLNRQPVYQSWFFIQWKAYIQTTENLPQKSTKSIIFEGKMYTKISYQQQLLFFFHLVKKVGRKLKSLLHLQLVFQSCWFFFIFFFFFVFVSVLSSSLFSPFNDTTENIYHKPSTERWRKLELWGNVDTVHAGKEHKPTNYSAMLVVIANTL